MARFTLDGAVYETDSESMYVLYTLVEGAMKHQDPSAIIAWFLLGAMTGRIREVAK